MTTQLLLVTIGPVQDFIGEARRTRDLRYGSHHLSELSRAAARALVNDADLIFPPFERDDPGLEPCLSMRRSDGKAPANVANKLLAEVPSGVGPHRLARAVREA